VHRLDSEYDNLRAAMRWSLDHGDVPALASAGIALTRYGNLRGYLRELRAWWLEALELSIGADPGLRATVAFLLAIVLFLQGGDGAQVLALLEESYACFRALGDKWGMAHALLQLGAASPRASDPEAAVRLLSEAEALFRELGQDEDVAWSLWSLGALAQMQGDNAAAEALYAQGLAVVRGVGSPTSIAQAIGLEGLEGNMLEGLGAVALQRGELGRVEKCVREAALLSAHLASADHVAICALQLAGVALGRGDAMRAAHLVGAAEGLWGAVANGILPVYRPIYDQVCTDLSRRLSERAFASARDHGRRMNLAATAAYVLAFQTDPVSADPLSALTPREREVAQLAARGLANRQIAHTLGLAEGTSRVHVERILGKLGLHSRAQLAAWAVERGVLSG
jgi:non-specific serine/threonine protein kinase